MLSKLGAKTRKATITNTTDEENENYTLDYLMKLENITYIEILKMDIEGKRDGKKNSSTRTLMANGGRGIQQRALKILPPGTLPAKECREFSRQDHSTIAALVTVLHTLGRLSPFHYDPMLSTYNRATFRWRTDHV
ncbi:hypothetical protein ANCDUO_16559 [Ancylostoma duodenale]|uniref:Uncharacterized protein n=1 Tax=Ancylostoma duodenale TaxID=51022 RepID=A0A0C2G8H5_9BILA|nr:hypothetical protein ANCDUO_16559 [Ancylostoma duodenale]